MSKEKSDCDYCGDSYSKVNDDTLFLIDKVKVVKDKLNGTSWYRIGTLMKLRKELRDLEKETDKIAERLKRLDVENENPIQIIKRQ